MNDQAIEQEIQAKGKTAPRITLANIEANIAHEVYFSGYDGACGAHYAGSELAEASRHLGQLTFCVLTLRNGFTVTGESACASPENFDAEIGRKIARQNAVQKIWPLMGYQLRAALYASAVFSSSLRIVTFDEFVQHGRDNGGNIVGGMPWSFRFHGHPVSHENDRCYIIANGSIDGLRFTPDDVLVVNPDYSLVTMRAEAPAL
jgi:hypothetical protein